MDVSTYIIGMFNGLIIGFTIGCLLSYSFFYYFVFKKIESFVDSFGFKNKKSLDSKEGDDLFAQGVSSVMNLMKNKKTM